MYSSATLSGGSFILVYKITAYHICLLYFGSESTLEVRKTCGSESAEQVWNKTVLDFAEIVRMAKAVDYSQRVVNYTFSPRALKILKARMIF